MVFSNLCYLCIYTCLSVVACLLVIVVRVCFLLFAPVCYFVLFHLMWLCVSSLCFCVFVLVVLFCFACLSCF